MTEISIRDLNKDVAKIIIGNIEENAYNKFCDNSTVYIPYFQYESNNKTCSSSVNIISYVTKSNEKILKIIENLENKWKERTMPFFRRYSYISVKIDPRIDSQGVYIFGAAGDILQITNDRENAIIFLNKNKKYVSPINSHISSENLDDFLVKFDDEDRVKLLM